MIYSLRKNWEFILFGFLFTVFYLGKFVSLLALSLVALYFLPKFSFKNFKISFEFILPILYFFTLFISGLWSENKDFWWVSVQRYSAFLIFPLYFNFVKIDEKQFLSLEKAYIVGSLLSIFAHFIFLFYKIFTIENISFRDISYQNFILFGHPSYVAFFWILANIFAFDLYHKKQLSAKNLILISFLIFLGVFFSMSRIAIVFLSFFLIVSFYKILKIPFLYLALFSFYIVVALLNTERFRTIPEDFFSLKQSIKQPEKVIYSNKLRILTWDATWDLIKKNYWLGVGVGDINDQLLSVYRQKNFRFPLLKKLNSHNQFLQTFAEIGIFGALILILMIFYPLYLGLKYDNFVLLWFFTAWFVFLLVESMFERSAGITFFAFFYGLIFLAYLKHIENQ